MSNNSRGWANKMMGKVVIDLNRRTVGTLGLLFNGLTPTRGAKIVCATIYGLLIRGPIKVKVEGKALFVQSGKEQVKIPSSQYYADCLYKSGVIEFELSPTTKISEVKTVLDILADKKLENAKEYLSSHSLAKVLMKPDADFETAKNINSSPAMLSDLFEEYFPTYKYSLIGTIMETIVSNPNTPWHIVAKVIGTLPQDSFSKSIYSGEVEEEYEIGYTTTGMVDGDGFDGTINGTRMVQRWETVHVSYYADSTIAFADRLLCIHKEFKDDILRTLKESNPDLYEAITETVKYKARFQ